MRRGNYEFHAHLSELRDAPHAFRQPNQSEKRHGPLHALRQSGALRFDETGRRAGGILAGNGRPFQAGRAESLSVHCQSAEKRAQNRFLSIAKAQKNNPDFKGFSAMPAPETAEAPRIPPAFSREQNSFQKFDLKTGQVLPSEKTPTKAPPSPISETKTKTPSPTSAKISHPPKEKPNSTAPGRRKKTKRMKSALPKIPKSTGTPVAVQNKQSFLARLGQLFRKFFQ